MQMRFAASIKRANASIGKLTAAINETCDLKATIEKEAIILKVAMVKRMQKTITRVAATLELCDIMKMQLDAQIEQCRVMLSDLDEETESLEAAMDA